MTTGSAKGANGRMGARALTAEIDAQLVEAIAHRVVELLRPELVASERDRLATAEEIAREFGVERDWVYANADTLGALRLGDGLKPRLRFDRIQARQVLASLGGQVKPGRSRRQARTVRNKRGEPLLPVYGERSHD